MKTPSTLLVAIFAAHTAHLCGAPVDFFDVPDKIVVPPSEALPAPPAPAPVIEARSATEAARTSNSNPEFFKTAKSSLDASEKVRNEQAAEVIRERERIERERERIERERLREREARRRDAKHRKNR